MNNKERKAVEDRVRKSLEKQLKSSLPERVLPLPGKTRHRFDMVSGDGQIVGEIKTSGPNRAKKGAELRSAQLGDLTRDCLLLLAPRGARKRIFVLTDHEVYEKFLETPYAQVAIAKGVDILLREA